jgi:hypothetical protein
MRRAACRYRAILLDSVHNIWVLLRSDEPLAPRTRTSTKGILDENCDGSGFLYSTQLAQLRYVLDCSVDACDE